MNLQIIGYVAMYLLIEKLDFVENKKLRQIMLDGFVKKHGEIPDEYKDAVNSVV